MNNRVISRMGARVLTPKEETIVMGGGKIGTATLCSAPTATKPADGDPGEC